jgi:aminopeptidase
MTDPRMQKLTDVLVNYSVNVQPGQYVGIIADVSAMPMIRLVHAAVTKAGGFTTMLLTDEAITRSYLRNANDDQLDRLDPLEMEMIERVDAMISLRATNNTRAMTGIDPKRVQRMAAARRPRQETFLRRSAEGTLQWTLTQYPTEASAQEANMSLEEYENFIYSATFCDLDDPVAEWRKVSEMQQGKVDYLKGKNSVRLKGPNIDLSLSIKDRIFINADGKRNMPDGEIFTGPVEDSVNGWVRFSYPSIVGGRAVSGIELRFEGGKVVEASAEQNDDLLQAQLNTDAGARYLGEFAIGTNFGIDRFTGNILYDEKIGGTIHMAVGASYPDTGGKNQSAVHWDMICDMRNDSEIYVDDELFYRNGEFKV